MKTRQVIKSLAAIRAEIVSAPATPATGSKLDAQLINARPDMPSPALYPQAGSGPVSPGVYEDRKARRFDAQSWTRGGLNE